MKEKPKGDYRLARGVLKGMVMCPVDIKDLPKEIEQLIQQAKADVAREIFEAYDSYIKLLGEEIDSLMSLAISHGWQSSKVEAGEKCRAGIQSLKDKWLKEAK